MSPAVEKKLPSSEEGEGKETELYRDRHEEELSGKGRGGGRKERDKGNVA